MTTSAGIIKCQYCGLHHDTICLRIKAIEYHPNGVIKRLEFKDDDTPSYDLSAMNKLPAEHV